MGPTQGASCLRTLTAHHLTSDQQTDESDGCLAAGWVGVSQGPCWAWVPPTWGGDTHGNKYARCVALHLCMVTQGVCDLPVEGLLFLWAVTCSEMQMQPGVSRFGSLHQ